MTQTNWKNVNNWHWIEKNCLPWTRDYFREHLTQLHYQSADGGPSVKITGVSKCDGDVDLNMRKGKLIYLFDLKMCIQWTGLMKSTDESPVEGELKLNECCFDDEPEDYEREINIIKGQDTDKVLEKLVEKQLYPQICALFRQFPKDLLKENGDELLVAESATKVVPAAQQAAEVVTLTKQEPPTPSDSTSSLNVSDMKKNLPKSSATCSVTLRTEFKCAAADLYQALTNPERSRIWAAGAELKAEPGHQFQMFGGNIMGTVVECVENQKIVWRWAMKSWKEESEVTLLLDQGSDSTVIRLTQVGVPRSEEEEMRTRWEQNLWDRMKMVFGWGL